MCEILQINVCLVQTVVDQFTKIKIYLIPVLVFETYLLLFNVIVFQVYYHLGAFDDSLAYALGAGDLFDVNGHSEYVETIIGMVNDF